MLNNDSFVKKVKGCLVKCTLGYVLQGERCKNKPNQKQENTNQNNNKIMLTCVNGIKNIHS